MDLSKLGKSLAIVAFALLPAGCARLGYYAHLGTGGLALVVRGERVETLLSDPSTSSELKDRLRFASGVLEFAEGRLGLPVGKKYRKYLDLERDYVAWTVVAAPEFSLEPETWCFPIAGCVGYRGFFTPEKADRFADGLQREGFDVSVGGVRAFSSLGWFGDPLLNTFLFDEDRRLASLLFHELAHGVAYAKDDTAFNESFATAVERAGVRLWLREEGAGPVEAELAEYQRSLDALDDGYARVDNARGRLEALYSDPGYAIDRSMMRALKAEVFADLQRDLASSDPEGRAAFGGWIGRELNNADLASVGFYLEHLASFEGLLSALGGDLERFYASALCLADLAEDDRSRRLDAGSWGDCILGGSR